MDKRLIGLIVIILIAVVTVSGCIGDDDDSMSISGDRVDDDTFQETGENSVPRGDSSPRSNDTGRSPDPEPNEEPEPPADD